MDFKMIEVSNQKMKIKKDTYNFIIEEKWIQGWGHRHHVGCARPKFYIIKKNGETILHTSLHQTFFAYKRKMLKEAK